MPVPSWRTLLSRLFSGVTRNPRGRVFRPRLVPLEDRTVPATFFVALTGNDGNAGTAASPFRTVQAGVNAAAAVADGDDIVEVADGTYATAGVDQAITLPNSANLTNLQLLGGFDDAFTTQTPGSTVYIPQQAGAAGTPDVNVLDADVTLNGFTFIFDGTQGDGGTRASGGIFSNTTGLTVSQNMIEVGIRSGGTSYGLQTVTGSNPTGLNVTGNTFLSNAGTTFTFSTSAGGIFLNPDTGRTTNIVISDNTFTGPNISSAVIVNDGCSNVLITNNSISRSGTVAGVLPLIDIRQTTAAGPTQSGIVITQNTINGNGAFRGIYLTGRDNNAAQLLNGVTITANVITGVVRGIDASFPQVQAAGTVIARNSITNISGNPIFWSGTGTLDLSGNWWGTAVGTGPNDVGRANIEALPFAGTSATQIGAFLSSGDNTAAVGFTPAATTEMWVPQRTLPLTRVNGVIQSGINAAPAGMVVRVASDTYAENLVLARDHVNLIGSGIGSTVLQSAVANTGTGIQFNGSRTDIRISDLSITGYNFGVDDTGGATLSDILFRDVSSSNNGTHGFRFQSQSITDMTLLRVTASGNNAAPLPAAAGRGVLFQSAPSALRTNVFIQDGTFNNNRLVGIDLNDGTVTEAVVTGNTVVGNGDAGISILGVLPTGGPSLISSNTITDNGRFGITMSNSVGNGTTGGPGSLVIADNIISRTTAATDLRDHAGIVVVRRNPLGPEPDQPSGTLITHNTVTGYRANAVGSTGEGFGIVVEGLNQYVTENIVDGNDVGIQIQAGNPAINAQNTAYMDRGNATDASGLVCCNQILLGNTIGLRTVGTLSSPISFTHNWWGSATGPAAGQVVALDSAGAAVTPPVVTPFLLAPDCVTLVTPTVDGPAAEGGTLTFTFTLDHPACEDLTIDFDVTGLAAFGDDYTQSGADTFDGTGGTVVIPLGQSSATVTLTLVNDRLVEGDETVTLTVPAGTDIQPGTPGSATGTITDNDFATLGFVQNAATVGEGDGTHPVDVVLTITADGTGDEKLARAVSADVTAGGSADVTLPTSPAVTFAVGALSGATKTANVGIVNDNVYEGDEVVTLGLGNVTGPATVNGSASSQALTIVENDPNPPIAQRDYYRMAPNRKLVVPASGVLANDEGAQSVRLVRRPVAVMNGLRVAPGRLRLRADGSFVYTPPRGFRGWMTFTYRAVGSVAASAPVRVTIRVGPPRHG